MKNIIFSLLIISFLSSCQKENISTGTNADDAFFLKENGTSLPIKVHGNIASKKMLVIVHGGPGGSSIGYRNQYVIDNIEKEFAIAYFDQRIAGGSQGSVSSSEISLFKSDLKKVVQLLKSRYGTETKMYIMGHSWGGFLTPYFLQDGDNQNLVKGWIQVDGAHNYYKNDSLTREMLLFNGKREIAANKNIDRWKEIVDYANAHAYNESLDVAFQFNRYASSVEELIGEISTPESVLENRIGLVRMNKVPITSTLSNLISSALIIKIDRQAYTIPISQNLNKLKLPTLLLWGRHDFVCPIGLADDIKKNIGSKDLTQKTFEKSGHSPMDNEPELFWKAAVDWVKVH